MGYYGSLFYGSDTYDGTVETFLESLVLRDYISDDIDNRVLYWIMTQLEGLTSAIFGYKFFVQVDETPEFNSSELKEYDETNAIQTIEKNYIRGFVISLPTKGREEKTLYWRVGLRNPVVPDYWSETKSFILNRDYFTLKSEELLKALPDYHVYNHDELKQDVEVRTSNLWKFLSMYGQELERIQLESIFTKQDYFVEYVRDSQVQEVFGQFYNFIKPSTMSFQEYREIMRLLQEIFLNGSTVVGIKRLVKLFTGVFPDIELIRDNLVSRVSNIEDSEDIYWIYESLDPNDLQGNTGFCWSKDELQNGVIIKISNLFSFSIYEDVLEQLLDEIKPQHTKIYIQYV